MTWIDLGALVLVALAVVDGARSGLAWAIVELAFLGLAAWLTGMLRPLAEPYVLKVASLTELDLPWVSHAALFALLACVLMGLAFLLHPMCRRARFRRDGWPGGVVGALSGLLAALVLTSLAAWHSPRPYEEQLRGAFVVDILGRAHAAGLAPLLPEGTVARLGELRPR